MSSTQTITDQATGTSSAATVDLKLEVVVLPVADVDRAKRFYENLGWRLDIDFANGTGFRAVQMTPPGSPCSIHFGTGVTGAVPGSVSGLYLVVADVEAARAELAARGASVSEPFHFTALGGSRVAGVDPQRRSYNSFATFADPDGNTWLLQEITTRLPGRGLSNLDFADLTSLLREAETRHGGYEPTAPKHHWSGWYAGYIVARAQGKSSEDAVKAATARIEAARG